MARRAQVTRAFPDAQHEAAHVVVGLALGLRLHVVRLDPGAKVGASAGAVIWYADPWPREAVALMYAAGVVWERRICGKLRHAAFDLADLRRMRITGKRLTACERAAWAVLAERSALHARISRALVERDLSARDVRALAFRRDYDAA